METTAHDYSRVDGFTMVVDIVGAIDCRISAQRAQNAAAGHLVPIAIQGNLVGRNAGGPAGVGVSTEGASYTLTKADVHAVAFHPTQDPISSSDGSTHCIGTGSSGGAATVAVAFRKSKRAQSVTDDESWVEAEQANTMNAFDTGERDTHAIVHSLPDAPKTPADQVCIECGNDLAVAENWHCLECLSDDPKLSTITQTQAIGLDEEQNAVVDGFGTLKARMEGGGFEGSVMTSAMAVRRLTPRECERLQAFPDDYTMIPWRGKSAADCPDGPRYKALGNSMAVNCMEWIGERIAAYEEARP
jgi:site-specific DNA-cytosine methylase